MFVFLPSLLGMQIVSVLQQVTSDHLWAGSAVNVKVKLTLEQATRPQRESRGIALLFL